MACKDTPQVSHTAHAVGNNVYFLPVDAEVNKKKCCGSWSHHSLDIDYATRTKTDAQESTKKLGHSTTPRTSEGGDPSPLPVMQHSLMAKKQTDRLPSIPTPPTAVAVSGIPLPISSPAIIRANICTAAQMSPVGLLHIDRRWFPQLWFIILPSFAPSHKVGYIVWDGSHCLPTDENGIVVEQEAP